jgi:hypothetical protein
MPTPLVEEAKSQMPLPVSFVWPFNIHTIAKFIPNEKLFKQSLILHIDHF